MKWLSSKLILILLIFITSCIVLNNRVLEVDRVDYSTKSNLKIHLNDGSLIISPDGLGLSTHNDSSFVIPATGASMYDLHRNPVPMRAIIWLDDVVFVENYSKEISAASLPGSAAAFTGGSALALLIFGSCPTFYSMQGDLPMLEGEGFSYSIAPRFEENDLDKLIAGDNSEGTFSLIIRNEAWETHYINQLNVVSIDHSREFEAFPSVNRNMFFKQEKKVILMGPSLDSLKVICRSGKDISSMIEKRDKLCYRSDMAFFDQMTVDPSMEDWLELEVPVPEGQKEMVIGFKLRNTLLNSLFLYEQLLDRQNFEAIDWINHKSSGMIYAMNFYRWYTSFFGLKIDLQKNGKFVEFEHMGDTGPTAWNYRAFAVPVHGNGTQKIRLRFIPDNWEIDWIGVSLQRDIDPDMRLSQLIEVTHKGKVCTELIDPQLKSADKEYLVTSPGEEYQLKFEVDPLEKDMQRSYFIQSRGFYMEWLRKHWLEPNAGEKFREPVKLDDALIRDLYKQWDKKKVDFEGEFFESMVPINNMDENVSSN